MFHRDDVGLAPFTYPLPIRFLAAVLIVTVILTVTLEKKAFASHFGAPAAAGSAGAPAGRILESFHSDLSTGRAVFAIPLAVPPGRRGMQPALSLNYSSSAKNGPLGVGWTLELGSIERSTRFGLPKFDNSDTFTLQYGGVTSDLVQTAPGEYRPKDEQAFSKILFNGTSWSITSKDGTRATLGSTPDAAKKTSRGVLAWLLNEVQDIHGNRMTVTYTTLNRQVYPSSIYYTAHSATGLTPQHEVRFIWESRPDVEWDERFGDRIETAQRLKFVETYTNGALVRRYGLSYRQSGITGRSLLGSVTTTGSDGITAAPSMTLAYSDRYAGWEEGSSNWKDLDAPNNQRLIFLAPLDQVPDTGLRLEDLDGDSRADGIRGSDGALHSWRNTGDGWVPDDRWAPPYQFITGDYKDTGARFADLNGDGRADLLYGRANATPTEAVYLNTGTGWTPTTDWKTTPSGPLRFVDGSGTDLGLRLVELNGDGKTDLLTGRPTELKAFLNTGTGWVEDSRWAPPNRFVAVNGHDYGCRFADLNGDGLTDLLYAGVEQAAYLNTGAGWKRVTNWNFGDSFTIYDGSSGRYMDKGYRLVDVNGDGLVDLLRGREGDPMEASLNTGTGWRYDPRFMPPMFFVSSSYVDKGIRFADLNGDGLTDLPYGTPTSRGVRFGRSMLGETHATPPDLLERVANGVGGTTSLTYRPSSAYDNTGGDGISDLPFVTQTVATQTLSNGLGWSATTQFTYSGGKFDTKERDFLGFAYAKVTDPVGTTQESWFHQDIHLKGRPYKQEVKDATGKLYSRTENAWACGCEALPPRVHFCHLDSSSSTLFDGDETLKQTKVSYTYDSYGNLASQVEEGDTAVTGDERTTTTEYSFNPTLWLMSYPSHMKTVDSTGNKLAESWVTYDGNVSPTDPPVKGLPTRTESWLSPGSANPIVRATYDPYGNKLTSTDPLGRTTTTVYDANGTFPIQVTNALGHTLKTSYDPGTGAVLATTDPNNQTTRNVYDPLGRLTAVIGPQDTDSSPGVRYSYDLSSVPTRVTKEVKFTLNPPLFTSGYYTTYSFADGLGRTIQTRSQAKDSGKQIVTGNTELGPRGETVAQYLPRFESNSTSYSSPPADLPKVRYEYDAIGRLVKTTDPDGAVSTASYSDWTVTATDAKGNVTTKESDAFGRLIKVTESATADHAAGITTYTYDPAGRLTKVTDAKGNVNRMTYDSLGRKLTMADPDMGTWSYSYDLAGNLTQQTDAKGQVLLFTYDALNRLLKKQGKKSAAATSVSTLASYFYDTGTYANQAKPNLIGRLSKVTDTSGWTEFFYDLLGREVKTIKKVGSATFTVQREYDPMNRLTRLIYPDGTDLRYEYSAQGISRIYTADPSTGSGSTFEFLSNVDYNAAGETLKLQLGNGVTTDYTYDPNTLRIASIRTADSVGRTLQDFAYTFDAVGNLTQLADRANSAGQTFQYDALNRLTGATGAYGTYSYKFDPLGNLVSKDNGMTLTYGLTNGTKPHAVTSLRPASGGGAISLSYDANGNLTKKGTQTFTYDLQNRLTQAVIHNGTPGTIAVTLEPGWNCVGFPFDFKDADIRSILDSITLGTDYDQVSKPKSGDPPWVSFVGDADADETAILDFGQGFWIHLSRTAPVILTVSGTMPDVQKSLSLTRGWNAVAMPVLNTPVPVTVALSGLNGRTDYSEVKRWNAITQSFESLTATSIVNPGETLWVNMLRAKTWSYYSAPTKNNTTTAYTYDGDGGRVKVTVNGVVSGTYIGELYEALPGSTTRSHIFFGPTRIATLERTPVITARANGTWYRFSKPRGTWYRSLERAFAAIEDLFVGRAYADTTLPPGLALSFYHGDHLGSVNLITDHTGKQVELAEYAPFGSLSRSEQAPGAPDNPFHFTGKRLDSSTGLYYFHARYYDPELGRFIQPDTIVQAPSDPQTLNRYTYARNNPLIYTDPTGHSFWKKVKKFFKKAWQAIVTIGAIAAAPFTGGQSLWLLAGMQVYSGVQAARAGQFGAWAAGFAISMALGFAIPIPDFSNIFLQVGIGALRGAAIGAVAGGVASIAAGGSFGAGARYGAIGGAIGGATAAFFTSQHFTNWKGGHGFASNQRVIDNFAKQGRFQEAIDFAAKRIPGFSKGTYDPTHANFLEDPNVIAFTEPTTGQVVYGQLAFSERSLLQATGFHEGVHVQQVGTGKVAWASDPQTREQYIANRFSLEVEASKLTLQNARRLELTPSVIAGERAYMQQNEFFRQIYEEN